MITERNVDNYMREITVTYKLSEEQEKKLKHATEKFEKLANSRGKKGCTEDENFIMMMSYAYRKDIDEKFGFWEALIDLKSEQLTSIIDEYGQDLDEA